MMKVKVLLNYEDQLGKVHLVNDVLDIDKSMFNPSLHSEDVKTKKRAVTNNRKQKQKAELSDDDV